MKNSIMVNGEKELIITSTLKFEEHFGNNRSAYIFITPASLILLGDHTHYNDGLLLCTTVNKFSVAVARKRNDNQVHLIDIENQTSLSFHLPDINQIDDHHFRHQICLLKLLSNDSLLNNGFDCIINSDIPDHLGLGGLAAKEICFASAIKKILNINISGNKLLEYVRNCELQHIGKISNIANHYATKYAIDGKLFTIDLRKMEYKSVPFNKEKVNFVIINTKERIPFVSDICNERISECEIGIKGLRLYIWGIKNLRDVEQNFLLRHIHMLPKKIFNRILYNVNERIRTEEGIKFLKKNLIEELGNKITESHWGLSHDYEISNDKCDFLVEQSSTLPGIIGSKMISCSPFRATFHIVQQEKTKQFIKKISAIYKERYKTELEILVLSMSDGTTEIPIKKLEMILSN